MEMVCAKRFCREQMTSTISDVSEHIPAKREYRLPFPVHTTGHRREHTLESSRTDLSEQVASHIKLIYYIALYGKSCKGIFIESGQIAKEFSLSRT